MKTQLRPLFITLTFICLLLPKAQAVSPPPDGGYPGLTTAEGDHALNVLTSGLANTAIGWYSLSHATTGNYNTGVGAGALDLNTGNENTATGVGALLLNTTGVNNTANGAFALVNNTGQDNTALGDRALQNNTAGAFNTAAGSGALTSNTTGARNNAFGSRALLQHVTGHYNNAFGGFALFHDTSGTGNNAFGDQALLYNTGNDNTAIGDMAGLNLTTGSGNVCIGASVGGVAGENNSTRIKNIGSTSQNTGIYVTLDAVDGTKLGYVNQSSSRRYKEDIKPLGKTSEALFALQPVNFRYKEEFDPDRAERFGLIAEDVEKVNPDLVAHNDRGELTTVRYECINAMLLNEFLKEHRTVQEQGAIIARQQTQIEALTAGLQKVSAQLELTKSAPQTVLNSQ